MTLHISHSTEKIDHFENKYYREVRRGMQPSSKIGGGDNFRKKTCWGGSENFYSEGGFCNGGSIFPEGGQINFGENEKMHN